VHGKKDQKEYKYGVRRKNDRRARKYGGDSQDFRFLFPRFTLADPLYVHMKFSACFLAHFSKMFPDLPFSFSLIPLSPLQPSP